MNKHIFIMIRYSVLTKSQSSWDIGRGQDFESYRKKLFDPDRLELHEQLFKSVTFPSLCEMNEEITTILIFISDELPNANKENLLSFTKNKSNFKIVEISKNERVVGRMNSELHKELSLFDSDICYATVRLDDDDALADNFESELLYYISPEFSKHAVSFPLGYNAFYEERGYTSFQSVKYPLIALGLSYIDVFRKKNKEVKSVYSLGKHTTIDERCPVIIKSNLPLYIRTIHKESDIYYRKFKDKNISADKLIFPESVGEYFSFLRNDSSLIASVKTIIDHESTSDDVFKNCILTYHGTFLCLSNISNEFLHLDKLGLQESSDASLVYYDAENEILFSKKLGKFLALSCTGKVKLVDSPEEVDSTLSYIGNGFSISPSDCNLFLTPLRNGKTKLMGHCKAWEIYFLY